MYRFSKQRRLLKKSDYDHVFQQAKKLVTPEFIFLYRINNLGHGRLGLALSKKAVAKAHDRNRLKRLLRESFRRRELPTIDVVVLARSGVADLDKPNLTIKLGKAWDRLSALCNK
ncbi:ribonuclease P protein component [Legionella yabuuchiae]|uniref:ribonuclease P protein component n=1 Tax=Legionella yabuuchiae TaxID=376727 RepID=UPI00105508F5|nr:ribonuclease P protein component [Legionella yabuuchiae]